jgi:drug/metabolite transporter (DMT)-like permease
MEPASEKGHRLRGSLILLAGAVIWGFAFAAQTSAMDDMGALGYNTLRLLIGGVALALPAFISAKRKYRDSKPDKSAVRRLIVCGLLCGVALAAASLSQQYGIALTRSPGKSSFITSLYIIMVPVIGLFTGRRPSAVLWPCAAAAAVGFLILCGGFDVRPGPGELMLLACAVLYSVQITLVDRSLSLGVDPLCLSCAQFLAGGAMLTPFMLAFDLPQAESVVRGLPSLLYVSLVSGALGFTFQIIGQRDCPPTPASLLMSLESVFGALGGYIFLDAKLTPLELCGCAIVLVAVTVAQIPFGSKKQKTSE